MKRLIIILVVFVHIEGNAQYPLFINDGYGNLYSVNLNNCTSYFIGKSPQIFEDIAFTPDGRLWGVDNDALYQIDTADASTTYIGFNPPATYSASLVALNDSTLLGEQESILYGISTKNAQSYIIGTLFPYYACGDLTWYHDTLYMNSCNQLIKIVLNSTYTAILNTIVLDSVNNLLPQMYAIATVPFNGSDSIVGFGGFDGAYIISPIDAALNAVCYPLKTGAYGAATMSFPILLPIHLLNFNSALINKTVQLQWQTTTEINSSYFLVERSIDGVNFSGIGKVNAAGNSTALKQYSFIDQTPLSARRGVGGEAFYRLKEVDLDGKYTYSKILLVKMQQANALNIIQNPVQDVLQIQINASPQTNYISIFDFTGRRIKAFNVQSGLQNIDVSFLSSGTYILQLITADGKFFDKPFVKR